MVAVVRSEKGLLALYACNGKGFRKLSEADKLVTPSAVRVRGNRVVVWEKSVGRISRFTF